MRADTRFLVVAAPSLAIATVALRRTGLMRTSQREFLNRCGPWARPALAGWMVAANVVTIAAPLLITRRRSDEAAARSTVRSIASLLGMQAALEAAFGPISDKAHPVTGMTFTLYRLSQLDEALEVISLDPTPRVQLLLGVQKWFWRANVVMLLVTAVARTVMRPQR